MPADEDEDEEEREDDETDDLLRRIARAPSVAAHPDMLLGSLVAERFRVEELAGQGGMGAVYGATDLTTGERVALKVLLRDLEAEPVERFLRESSILSMLAHPSIVRHVADGRSPRGEPYLAMEWLEGQTLATRLATGALGVEECVALGGEVVRALGVAHDRGILHRDVKPQNVFLVDGPSPRVKLLDFGLARPKLDLQRMTRTGASVGTPAYMAPEQARGASALDERVDIWGLGATMFECLTGRPPFVAPDVTSLLGKILFEEPPRASALRTGVPEALDRLLAQMLAKESGMRPRHHEVARALAFVL